MEARCSGGLTALHWAAMKGHLESVECLINLGADIHAADLSRSFSPLQWAMIYKRINVVNRLLLSGAVTIDKNVNGQTALHIAAFQAFAEGITALIARAADVNAIDNSGYTPLNYADENFYTNHNRPAPIDWQQESANAFLVSARERSITINLLRSHGAKTKSELESSCTIS